MAVKPAEYFMLFETVSSLSLTVRYGKVFTCKQVNTISRVDLTGCHGKIYVISLNLGWDEQSLNEKC